MNYENYDNDADESDDDYFEFVRWLSERTAAQLREAKGKPELEKQVLCRYWKRGKKAGLTGGELIDFLGVSTPSILDAADYNAAEVDALFQISDNLTQEEIQQAVLEESAAQLRLDLTE